MTTTVDNATSSLINSLNAPSATQQAKAAATATTDNSSVSENQFLQLLITQLKNQDPTNPMDDNQFAVQLAQFSEVEQLTQINGKIGGTNDASSLASYLGKDISFNGTSLNVASGNGGQLSLDLPSAAADVKVTLANSNGSVAGVFDAGAVAQGTQKISLQNVAVPDGNYTYSVKAFDSSGNALSISSKLSGVVSGFVPGANPTLVVGSQEVSPSDILQVGLGS